MALPRSLLSSDRRTTFILDDAPYKGTLRTEDKKAVRVAVFHVLAGVDLETQHAPIDAVCLRHADI